VSHFDGTISKWGMTSKCRTGVAAVAHVPAHEAISSESSRPGMGANRDDCGHGALGGCNVANFVAGADDESEGR